MSSLARMRGRLDRRRGLFRASRERERGGEVRCARREAPSGAVPTIEQAAALSEVDVAARALDLWWSGDREEAERWIALWHSRFGRQSSP